MHGLNWTRRLDRCRHDTDGLVNFDVTCANNGAIVASEDASKCCSRRTRAYNAQTDGAMADLQGVIFDGSFTPVVCEAAPPVGQRCTSNAQCPAGKQCLAASPGSLIKICRVNDGI
jgi:Cys-rich repeat protein